MNPKHFENVLRAGQWFGSLPTGFQEALLEAATLRTLGKREQLFARGDPPSGLYAVVVGSIRIAATTAAGDELLFTIVEPPMWFGEIAAFDQRPRTHDAIATDATTLVHVPQAALEGMLAREPAWWRDLGVLVTTKLRLTFLVVEDAALPLAVRLARRLVLAAERYGEWVDRSSRVVEIRQEQLATMLTTSRQTINQILKELETRGLVTLAYGRIEIVDLEGLRAEAGRTS